MYKISKIGVGILAIIGAILWIALVFFIGDTKVDNAPMNWMFIISYILMAFSILLLWILPVVQKFMNNEGTKAIIYFLLVLVLLGYIYCVATGIFSVDLQLIISYIIIAAAVLLLVVIGVKNALTK